MDALIDEEDEEHSNQIIDSVCGTTTTANQRSNIVTFLADVDDQCKEEGQTFNESSNNDDYIRHVINVAGGDINQTFYDSVQVGQFVEVTCDDRAQIIDTLTLHPAKQSVSHKLGYRKVKRELEHSYAIDDTPQTMKRKISLCVSKCDAMAEKLKLMRQKARRLNRQLETFKYFFNELQQQDLIRNYTGRVVPQA